MFRKRPLENLIAIGFVLVIGFFSHSCSEPPTLKLTSSQRDLVDTLFYHKTDSLRPILDAQCNDQHEKRLQFLIDSMIGVRQGEEAYLRQKYIPAFNSNQ
jgi:hypothetical protein